MRALIFLSLLFLPLLLTVAAVAQEPDTTAPARYVPLEVGNRWEYTYAEGQVQAVPRGYWRWVVRADTALGGRHYVVLDQTTYDLAGALASSGTRYVRYDTTQARLVTWEGGADASFPNAPCPFDLPFEGVECGTAGYPATQTGLGYGQDAGLGVTTSVKRFELGLTGYAVRWAAGLGFVLYETIVPKGGEIEVRIAYARVGGVSYGTPVPVLPVVATAPAPVALGLVLSVTPNPASRAVTLTLALPAPGPVRLAVYDGLGREVAVLADGALTAGAHAFTFDTTALPAGVYLARATAGAASTTARLTLAH